MILRLKRLAGLTRWNALKGANFQRTTIIYGENGRGKTSLVAAIRSLVLGEPNLVLERRTIAASTLPDLEFLIEIGGVNATRSFDGSKWNGGMSDVEIFDTRFVSDNVYSGDAIESDQRRGLHKFVLGAANVALAESVDRLDAEVRNLNASIAAAETTIKTLISGVITADDFLRLTAAPTVTVAIEAQSARVRLAQQRTVVTSTPPFDRVVLPATDPGATIALLESSLEQIAGEADRRVRDHIRAHLDDAGKPWLEKGLRYLDDNSDCPFCGLSTVGNELIGSYRVVFGDAYREHREHFEKHRSELFASLGDAAIVTAAAVIAANEGRTPFWRQHDVPCPDGAILATLKPRWIEAHNVLTRLLGEKQRDVLASVHASRDDHEALAALAGMRETITNYNAAVDVANAAISTLKSRVETSDVGAEQSALDRIKLVALRSTPSAIAACAKLEALRAEKKVAEASKTKARAALEASTATLFDKYELAINQHLANSGCGYRIVGTKVSFVGGKPRTEYQLVLNGQAVELSQPRGDPLAPFFGNTLSGGDRSTLAFALFLARLDLDPALANRIVMIDDPMTSLDAHRRAYTCEQLSRLSTATRQLILLSHDPLFLKEAWDRIPAPKTALVLNADGDSTIIDEWDIVAAMQSEYFKRCGMLLDCVSGKPAMDLLAVAGSIRPVLEGNLRMRFPRLFQADRWLGDFIGFIRDAEPPSPLVRMKSQMTELAALNDYSKRYHHDENPGAVIAKPDLAQLQSYCTRALSFIGGTPTT